MKFKDKISGVIEEGDIIREDVTAWIIRVAPATNTFGPYVNMRLQKAFWEKL